MTKFDDVQHHFLTMSRHDRVDTLNTTKEWDLIVIGGGITGAGILKCASLAGLKVLLIEQKDFAWGSSSKSSKMVHGGLRYLAKGQGKLALESVQERQRLYKEASYLVTPQSFVMAHYKNNFPSPFLFNLLLTIYDFLAQKKQHRFWPNSLFKLLVPSIKEEALVGGTQFVDGITDDARLVLRLLQEAQQQGAIAINYTKAIELIKEKDKVVGVRVEVDGYTKSQDETKATKSIKLLGKCVVNATGAWTEELQVHSNDTDSNQLKIRPLRGSHLVIPNWRLPVGSALSVLHPDDKRPVQIYPWQNTTIVGTTDIEHRVPLCKEPRINQDELDYLLRCVAYAFPKANLSEKDILSTYSGVRPVIDFNTKNSPSSENREHAITERLGFITVAGGKLTTFRLIAKQVVERVNSQLKRHAKPTDFVVFDDISSLVDSKEGKSINNRFLGIYGVLAPFFLKSFEQEQFNNISYSRHVWAEVIWALKYEQVHHLDDLMLRRTRLGNVLPNGGLMYSSFLELHCRSILGWCSSKWQQELERYENIIKTYYSLPSNSPTVI